MIRAVGCNEFGPPSVLAELTLPMPEPGPGEVRVKVHAVGLGFHDLLLVAGKYQLKPPFPVIPGSDVTGTIDALGQDVSDFRLGDRVIAITDHGGCAECVTVSAKAAALLPAGIDFVTGAAIGMTYGTAHQALIDRAALKAGEVLLVRGASGGVGRAAVEIGRHLGATVLATASSPEKQAIARAAGAHHVVDAAVDVRDRVRSLTDGRGADVIFDPVGEPGFRVACLAGVAYRGRILIVGFAGGEIPAIPAHYLINKFCTITGVAFGGFFAHREPEQFRAILQDIVAWAGQGVVSPLVTMRVTPGETARALDAIASRSMAGRAVVAFA
ncbi:MAG: NADPH:quinone oxidoreductase family protein [Hyphomicrobiaceae bacterium]